MLSLFDFPVLKVELPDLVFYFIKEKMAWIVYYF